MQVNNENAQASGLLGFRFDMEPVKTYYTQINAISEEAKPILQTGSMNDFDQYIEETKAKYAAAGIEEIKAEAERQIAEWRKEN